VIFIWPNRYFYFCCRTYSRSIQRPEQQKFKSRGRLIAWWTSVIEVFHRYLKCFQCLGRQIHSPVELFIYIKPSDYFYPRVVGFDFIKGIYDISCFVQTFKLELARTKLCNHHRLVYQILHSHRKVVENKRQNLWAALASPRISRVKIVSI